MKQIKLKHTIVNDEYTDYVYSSFDIQNQEETVVTVEYDLSELESFDWNIGVIYGNSGSGKSTILKQLGELQEVEFDNSKALISNFDWLEPKDAARLLNSMGLSSVPTWLRPFNKLSNGEQYRAKLAYKVGRAGEGDLILIDEYTSVVDRTVAKAMSFALQKYIRRMNKKIILASCHFDIMEWLMPDWTCSPQKGGALERGDWLRQGRPKIELRVSRVEYEAWDFFKEHHYMTEAANKSCKFFLFEWEGHAVGICGVINQPRNNCPNGFALSRLVILPDYQGLGIGSKICEFCAAIFRSIGGQVFAKTVNPALGEYWERSDNWRPTLWNRRSRGDIRNKDPKAKNRLGRISYCHEYVGEGITGYEDLMKNLNEMRRDQMSRNASQWFSF